MWSIELDLQQEKTLKDTYFETEWAKDTANTVANNINYLPLDKCYEFLIGLMSN